MREFSFQILPVESSADRSKSPTRVQCCGDRSLDVLHQYFGNAAAGLRGSCSTPVLKSKVAAVAYHHQRLQLLQPLHHLVNMDLVAMINIIKTCAS